MTISSTHLKRVWRTLDRWSVHFILAASLFLNVYFGLRVRALPTSGQSSPAIAVGTRAPNLYAEDMDGTKVVIDWAETSKPWILYIFSPSCVWCQRNTKNFETVVRDRQGDYRIIGLSTTSNQLADYVARQRLSYAVYANPDMSKSPIYGQTATPATYVISTQGIVQAVWRGAYAGDTKKRVEATLNVQLPGIRIN
jgi:peroxiredoxin